MCIKNAMELSLNGETFTILKNDFDTILKRTLGNMTMKSADEATITLKLSISLDKVCMGGGSERKEIIQPKFKHDISSVMQVKDKITGTLAGEQQMVWDEERQDYVLCPVNSDQKSLFDDDYETTDEIEHYEPNENASNVLHLLPDPATARDANEEAFLWLGKFVGQTMTVFESDGTYTLRTNGGAVIASSNADPSSPFFLSADYLAQHIGHFFTCKAINSEDDGEIKSVIVECECGSYAFAFHRRENTESVEGETTDYVDITDDMEFDDPDDFGCEEDDE